MSNTIDDVLATTRAVRRRLELQGEVPRHLVEECVALALQAPSPSNTQGLEFVVVDDPQKRLALAELYRTAFAGYEQLPLHDYPESDARFGREARVRASARYLSDHLHEVPILVVPVAAGRLPERAGVATQAAWWGSLLPGVWSFMLAARARGLGTAYTTLHLAYEREAADELGVPYESVTQGGLLPVAPTDVGALRRAARRPVEDVIHWNVW